MNEAQARRYLASLAKVPGLETGAAIGLSIDGCRVEFTPAPDNLAWSCRLDMPGADNMTETAVPGKDILGILLEVNGMGHAATFAMTDTGELLLRGGTLLNGLDEDVLDAQIGEFIDYVEYWQQQLVKLAG